MRILIDESLPRQLVPLLIGHDAPMVQAEGWSSVKNGELLRRTAAAESVAEPAPLHELAIHCSTYFTTIPSPPSVGVCTGRRRAFVSCSKA